MVYATEALEVSEAEAFIAERQYRQNLIQSRSYLLHMNKTRAKAEKMANDRRRLQNLIGNKAALVDPTRRQLMANISLQHFSTASEEPLPSSKTT